MTSQLDNSLALIYKNMVGLSTIGVDTSGNTFMKHSMSVNSNLFVCGNTILMDNTSIISNLNVNGNFVNNGNVSLNSSLNISGFTIINSNTTIGNSLNVSGDTVINNYLNVLGNVTNQSNLNVQGLTVCNSGINTNDINPISSTLNILGNTINIGNGNSIININGTATYVASTDTLIIDKLISLNVNSATLSGADNGMLSGIEILGTSSRGFIRTTNDASRFEIQAPLLNSPKNFITVQDINNNLNISGNTNLIGSTTINSNLFVNSSSLLNGATTVNNSIYISSNTFLNGPTIINSSLNVSGLTVINNSCSITGNLNINGVSIHNNNVSINSFLNISGNTIINGIITANNILNVNSNMINNSSVSINSALNVSGLTIINGLTSINNSLNISGTTNIGNNLNINSNLIVTGNTILNNNVSINSSLTVSGTTIFNNSISINSDLGIMGQIVAKLPNYSNNLDAKNGGVPLWGFYRTGGIIKIRLNDTPPTVYLSDASSITINSGLALTDPGAYALDIENNYNNVYMTSLLSGNTNLLLNNILISGISTLITQTTQLLGGSYTATYSATDSNGNIGYNYRLININAYSPVTLYDSSMIIFSNIANMTNNFTVNPTNLILNVNASKWGLMGPSPSYLSSINFNYDSNWCFVIKLNKSIATGNPRYQFQLDTDTTNWATIGGQGLGRANMGCAGDPNKLSLFNGTELLGYLNLYNTFKIGIYFNISYNYSISTINVEFADYSGNILYTGTYGFNYTNRKLPWAFYTDQDEITFYKGIYYNSSGYVPYSTYSQYF